MNTDDLLQKYKPLLKQFWLPIVLASLGLIFFVYGLIGLSGSSQPREEITFESADENKDTEKEEFSQKIFIDVEGAVINPGVYSLSGNSRVQDALVAAGGMSGNADREWVSKNLNLALKVKDGMKIYVPTQDEGTKGITSTKGIKGEGTAELEQQININTATVEELDRLPGVGMVTAQKIIDARPYGSIEELLENKVVSNSVFEKIKDKITTY